MAGASRYTTWEHCSARNPPKIPCAEPLVQRQVGRVFIGMLDTNPDIQGHGVRLLRDANIEVQLFPHELMTEIAELNRNFTRQFRDAPRLAETRFPAIRAISSDKQKIADIGTTRTARSGCSASPAEIRVISRDGGSPHSQPERFKRVKMVEAGSRTARPH